VKSILTFAAEIDPEVLPALCLCFGDVVEQQAFGAWWVLVVPGSDIVLAGFQARAAWSTYFWIWHEQTPWWNENDSSAMEFGT
jgi:hypothetical protein